MLNVTEYGIFHLETFGFIIPIIAWIASVFTFLYCILMFSKTFMGKFDSSKLKVQHVHEAPIGMLISPIILAVLVVVFGLFPNLLAYSIIEPAMAAIAPGILSPGEFLMYTSLTGMAF